MSATPKLYHPQITEITNQAIGLSAILEYPLTVCGKSVIMDFFCWNQQPFLIVVGIQIFLGPNSYYLKGNVTQLHLVWTKFILNWKQENKWVLQKNLAPNKKI